MTSKNGVIHEYCTTLYKTDYSYRVIIKELLEEYRDDLEPLKRFLRNSGYEESSLLSEIQAHLIAKSSYLYENKVKFPRQLMCDLQQLSKYFILNT